MESNKHLRPIVLAGLAALAVPATANVWVFEPSITLDQRFDDNYYLIPAGDGALSATRAVGELGLSRESQTMIFKGLARVDALLTTTNDNGDEGLDSNQLVAFEAKRQLARTRFGVRVGFKQDTPSRDIAADLSDPDNLATDTGLNVTQASNVARREVTLNPSYEFDITRRLVFDTKAAFTFVEHDLPDPQDAIYRFYIDTFPRTPDGNFDGVPKAYSEVTLDDVGGVFTPSGELDDFQEAEVEVGFRFKYTPITTLSFTAGFSQFNADVEPDPAAYIPFEDLQPDPGVRQIVRKPRRDSVSTTTTFKLGYERLLTPTLKLGVTGGVYVNTSDKSDTLKVTDVFPGQQIPQEKIDALTSESDGWLAAITLTRDAGLTRYVGRFSVDVEPSSSGAQVESQELTGDVFRVINPRLNVSLRARAFEPDRLGANREDRFARRFISIEPKVEWKYARNWTVAAAYRYRRQKARIDPVSAESNAILLSLTYTPPSEIRDAQNAQGLK